MNPSPRQRKERVSDGFVLSGASCLLFTMFYICDKDAFLSLEQQSLVFQTSDGRLFVRANRSAVWMLMLWSAVRCALRTPLSCNDAALQPFAQNNNLTLSSVYHKAA